MSADRGRSVSLLATPICRIGGRTASGNTRADWRTCFCGWPIIRVSLRQCSRASCWTDRLMLGRGFVIIANGRSGVASTTSRRVSVGISASTSGGITSSFSTFLGRLARACIRRLRRRGLIVTRPCKSLAYRRLRCWRITPNGWSTQRIRKPFGISLRIRISPSTSLCPG